MILLRILLLPFSWIFLLVTHVRNHLYDRGLKPSARFEVPVISVGNLSVGGTGKTPMIEHLIRILVDDFQIATLSRGYRRRTKGFRVASGNESPTTIGDEPFQLYKKFGHRITVAVGEERALAIPSILQEFPDTNLILLDDAFQHRKVSPSLSILLSDYSRPFYKDVLLPAGRLREGRQGAARADLIVVTKCPVEISDNEMMEIEHSIRLYAEKPVFFSGIRYGNPLPFSKRSGAVTQNVLLISGLANPKSLEDYIGQNFTLVSNLRFNDHHAYTLSDLEAIGKEIHNKADVCIITTEKDKVKLEMPEFQSIVNNLPFFYLPIEIDFLKGGKDFDEIVLNHVKGV
jgi:tetraacyldisaccharide 4'-kinase